MVDHPEPTGLEKSMPVKLEGISKKLWPRKIYVRVKAYHPIAGSVFITIWSIFWLILAIIINLFMIVVLLGTLVVCLAVIFGDSGFDLDLIGFTGSSDIKRMKKHKDAESEK